MSAAVLPVIAEPEVEHALFLLGYRNLVVTGFGQVLLASLIAMGSRGVVDTGTLRLWLGTMLLTGMVYWLLAWRFRQAAGQTVAQAASLVRWRRYRRSIQWISAVGWGGLGWLLVPQAQAHNIFIMMSFAGMVGYSAAGNAANDLPSFMISAVVLTALLVSRLPAVFGVDAAMMTAVCVLYVGALTLVVKNANRALRESIRLRLANEVLARENAEQARRADQANRDKSEFLAAASHDLRQPVHALLLLIEAYRQQVPGAAAHPLIEHIAAAGQSISALFNALMELSQLESGTEQPVLSNFDVTEVLHRVFNRVLPEAARKGLQMRRHQGTHLRWHTVHADKVLLERMVGNLLTNAVRYTHRGAVLLSLRAAHGGDGLWLEVRDTGVGIAVADQARIFNPYVQIGNQQRDRTQGLGLGLAIVRQASQLLGLGVSLRSHPGRGSCFRLHLPLTVCRPDPAPPLADGHPVALAQYTPRLSGRRVLLVDDDAMVVQAMRALLGGWAVDLRCAVRGEADALAVCAGDWVPECVLCDFRLPGALDGIALLDRLQEQFPRTVGILQTGELAQAVQQAAQEAGYLVLFKPVDAGLLARTLTAVLAPGSQTASP